MLLIGNTTIHRAYRGTLGLVMKPFAFGAFVRNNIIVLVTYRILILIGINSFSVRKKDITAQFGAI